MEPSRVSEWAGRFAVPVIMVVLAAATGTYLGTRDNSAQLGVTQRDMVAGFTQLRAEVAELKAADAKLWDRLVNISRDTAPLQDAICKGREDAAYDRGVNSVMRELVLEKEAAP